MTATHVAGVFAFPKPRFVNGRMARLLMHKHIPDSCSFLVLSATVLPHTQFRDTGDEMTASQLHPWLSTPEALEAAEKAAQIPLAMLPNLATLVGADVLHSEALAFLAECAVPPRTPERTVCAVCGTPLASIRVGAKFCTQKCRKQRQEERLQGGKTTETLPAHIGSMWGWPEDQRDSYAIRTVGYLLNNYLRTKGHVNESRNMVTGIPAA